MISVCMATYNGSLYLKQQVESILCQLTADDEIIISDDGSTDDTLSVLAAFNDRRIKIYTHYKGNRVFPNSTAIVTANFENAINQAKGDILFLSDQDDVWLPNKVEVMRKYLTDYDLVISDAYVTDADLNIIHDTRFHDDCGQTKNIWKAFISTHPYQGSCMAFRRNVLSKALPFPREVRSHDTWLGFVGAFYFKTRVIPEKLIYYRRHENVVSTTGEKSPYPLFTRIQSRLRYFRLLIARMNHKGV